MNILCPCVHVCRQKVWDLEGLRQAVKHEAGMLETRLKDMVHHCDDSLKRVYILRETF